MIITLNKSTHPYNGLNIHLRSLEKTGLTRHKMGEFNYGDDDLKHADMIILGNFLPQEVYAIRNNIDSKTKLGYMYCSPFGQAGCNGELNLLLNMKDLLKSKNLDFLFCTSKEMVDVLDDKAIKYTPVLSDFEGTFVEPHKRSGILLIGNNLRVSRNFPTQLAGLKFAQQLGCEEPIFSWGMDSIGHRFFIDLLKIENWTNYTTFLSEGSKREVIAKSKLGMQITYSDSFNIAAYEHAMCHVPCLISESLRWGIKSMRIAKIDNAKAIGHKVFQMLSNYFADFTEWNIAAKKIMDENLKECDRTLRNCL